jgi:hypothetical protein
MRLAAIIMTCCAFAFIAAAIGGAFKPSAYSLASAP